MLACLACRSPQVTIATSTSSAPRWNSNPGRFGGYRTLNSLTAVFISHYRIESASSKSKNVVLGRLYLPNTTSPVFCATRSYLIS